MSCKARDPRNERPQKRILNAALSLVRCYTQSFPPQKVAIAELSIGYE